MKKPGMIVLTINFVFYSDGLATMYSRSVNKSDLGKPLSVMVSVCNLNDN